MSRRGRFRLHWGRIAGGVRAALKQKENAVTDHHDAPANPWLARPDVRGADYDAPYAARALAGEDVHGEANAVMALHPSLPLSVLDAGCGTGRIAIELARRGADVVGVDLDPRMLERARAVAPALDWRLGDLATLDLGRTVDLVLLAGNVMLFVTPGSEGQVVATLAGHLRPGGLLVAGFQLGAPPTAWPTTMPTPPPPA
jgi:SAM-dependent methyltransferase